MPLELGGMSELLRNIEQLGQRVDDQLKEKALKKGAEILQEKIKETVPVQTGNLKENIIISEIKNDLISVGPDQQGDAFYGHFLEFGTSKAPAQPFMAPSLENSKNQIQEEMSEVIKRELGL